jgi:hypothetical protein
MYLMRVLNVLLVTAAVALFAVGARADSIPVASFNINGSMTVDGNNGSVETIHFAFVEDYFPDFFSGYDASVVGSVLASSSGPLGSFVSVNDVEFGQPAGGTGGYMAFFDNTQPSKGDEIDLILSNQFGTLNLDPPTAGGSFMYSCQTTACASDFSLIGTPQQFSFGPDGTAQFTATAIPTDPPTNTPEPPTILMISLGILGLLGIASMRTFYSKREAAPSR